VADGCVIRIACYSSIFSSKSIDIPDYNGNGKSHFLTTFDYIVAVIQALQFVDYKDVLRFYFFNAI
jgi:hypothetical protein